MLALLLTMILTAAPDAEPAPFVCRALAPKETIHVDMDEARLLDVARIVSCALDRNIMFQPPLVGDKRVTVLGPRPIDRRALEQLWHSLLLANGLISERHGSYDVIRAP